MWVIGSLALDMGGTTQEACSLDGIKGKGRLDVCSFAAARLLCYGLFLLYASPLSFYPALDPTKYGLNLYKL